MLLEQHLLQLFGNLPYLPKAEITKHLKELDLIKAYLVSENWDKAIERRKNEVARNQTKVPLFWMYSKEDRVEMKLLEFRSGLGKKLIIDFPVESALKSSTEIDEHEDRVICRSKSFEDFETRILMTFHKIRTWFDVDTRHIAVNLDLGFNLEFLKKLRLKKFNSFELSGDKKHHQIDSKELTDLMNTWDIGGSVQIRVETSGKFKGNLKMLRGSYCEFTDSRWITSDMFIEKFEGKGGILKRCLLTSEDFNAHFKNWINKGKSNTRVLECHLEHELDVEEVLEGLEAKKWNPMERGRIFRCSRKDTFTDLADGLDIYRDDDKLGTIHISTDKKVIKFFPWLDKFPLETRKRSFVELIGWLKLKLKSSVGSPRDLAEIAEHIEKCEARLQAVEEQIAKENQ